MHQPVKEYYTSEEAIAAFRSLSGEDQRKLVGVARACLGGAGFTTPAELLNEAYIRIAEGRRKWARDKTFVQFLAGTLRSLATDGDFLPEERKLVRRNKGSTIVTSEGLDTVSVEEDVVDEAAGRGDEALSMLEARFAGDYEMELLLMGIRDGLIGEDLQDFIGVDARRLEALRTRLNRELRKLAAVFGAKEGKP